MISFFKIFFSKETVWETRFYSTEIWKYILHCKYGNISWKTETYLKESISCILEKFICFQLYIPQNFSIKFQNLKHSKTLRKLFINKSNFKFKLFLKTNKKEYTLIITRKVQRGNILLFAERKKERFHNLQWFAGN